MSIQWMDNFNSYGILSAGQTLMLEGNPYTYAASGPNTDPINSSINSLQVWGFNNNNNALDNNLALSTPGPAVGVAFRYYNPAFPGVAGARPDLMQWRDNSGNVLYALTLEINGALSFYSGGSLVVGTVIPVITAGSFWHIETMVDYAAGALTLYIEGAQIINHSITAASTVISNIGWSPRQNFTAPNLPYTFMRDLIVYDKQGSINNSAGSIGPCTVYSLPPTTDVSNGWTLTGGSTVHGIVGAAPPNDADYISAGFGPFPAPAVNGIAPLPTTVVAVRGIMTLQRIKKSDGGVASYQMSIKSGTSTHTGTTQSPTTSFAYQNNVVELDPNTGAAWAPTAVDNLQTSLNRTV